MPLNYRYDHSTLKIPGIQPVTCALRGRMKRKKFFFLEERKLIILTYFAKYML